MTMKSGIRDTIKDNQANRASRNEELRSVIHGRFAEKRSLRAGGEANHSEAPAFFTGLLTQVEMPK